MKIYNINDIKRLDCETAVTVGMFDGVHIGHRQMVEHLAKKASERGLKPVVLTFRNHPRNVLRQGETMPLLTTFEERMELLEMCGVEQVVAMQFDTDTAKLSACEFARFILVERLNMRMLLLGYDNKFGSRHNDDFAMLPSVGKELSFDIETDEPVLVDGVDVSSTKIRNALTIGDIEKANRMLGAPYSLTGRVVHGRHVGSGIGFPTANIEVTDSAADNHQSSAKMLPADGVYAMLLSRDGKQYAAMGNLGSQPTYGLKNRTLEVHVIDFDGDLYGEQVRVAFRKRIRDVRQFENEHQLVEQLNRDKELCKL